SRRCERSNRRGEHVQHMIRKDGLVSQTRRHPTTHRGWASNGSSGIRCPPMDSAELLDRVRQLRGEGKSPKQIARLLGMAPSAVPPRVRAVAAQRPTAPQPQVVGCWVNRGWSLGLSVDPARCWTDEAPSSQENAGGLVSVLLARRHRWDKVLICGYLTD